MNGSVQPDQTLDALQLSSEIESALGEPPRYSDSFRLITEHGEVLSDEAAVQRLRDRGPNPVLSAVVTNLSDGNYRLIYERIASAVRFEEPWPAPAATVVDLDSDLRVVERRDYGGFIRE
jgi:hypothetical protein